jgi:putative oxidoreductase
MDVLHKIEYWADTHHPLWIDVLRMSLGLFLLYKGLIFVSDTDALLSMMSSVDLAFASMAVAHYIAFAHMIGGILIALGLLTRFAVLLQIPILIGAVFFVNPRGFFSVAYNMEFWVSLIVLMLLFVFLIYGSGRLSVTGYQKEENLS